MIASTFVGSKLVIWSLIVLLASEQLNSFFAPEIGIHKINRMVFDRIWNRVWFHFHHKNKFKSLDFSCLNNFNAKYYSNSSVHCYWLFMTISSSSSFDSKSYILLICFWPMDDEVKIDISWIWDIICCITSWRRSIWVWFNCIVVTSKFDRCICWRESNNIVTI